MDLFYFWNICETPPPTSMVLCALGCTPSLPLECIYFIDGQTLNDLFYIAKEASLCNFTDDTMPYSCGYKLKDVMKNVKHDCITLVEWFRENYLTLNDDKCNLLASRYKNEALFAKVGETLIWEENAIKLLGLIIDSGLTFNNHVKAICKKASQKLTAIIRMSNILSEYKRKLLIKTFFELQFNYCPWIWVFFDRTPNQQINIKD